MLVYNWKLNRITHTLNIIVMILSTLNIVLNNVDVSGGWKVKGECRV